MLENGNHSRWSTLSLVRFRGRRFRYRRRPEPPRRRRTRLGPYPGPYPACSSSAPSGVSTCRTALPRSEEHTSELQSHSDLVCRLLLEKKKYNFHNALG